ncbi:MAG: TolC family outer membrane protein [Chlorobiaceae bacterium]|nr:TolC family outer membrane protein [Chlorobiaceae bacterium]
MKKMLIGTMIAFGMVVSHASHAETVSLSSAYQKAVDYDSRYRVARADNLVYQEEVKKAGAAFLPSVRSSGSRGRNSTQHGSRNGLDPTQYYNTMNYGVSLRQSLLNISNVAEYNQSKAMMAKSDSDLRKEEVSLIVRITEAYCNALYAEDNLAFSKAHIQAAKEQLQQAKRRFDNGFGTITEVKEAQANHDMAIAEGVDINNGVEFSRRELEDLIGVYPDQLCRLAPEKLELKKPSPASVEEWIAISQSGNPMLASARQEIIIAKREIDKQRAMRLPTLDLIGGRNYSESENNYTIGSTYDTYSVALQVNVPIYTGGYNSASIRQARAKWVKAGEQFTGQERAVESDVRRYFNSVNTSIAQIQAYEQAMKSQEIAFTGTQKGFTAGLRSNVDVLEAERKLLESRRNLAKSRYQYILNTLMLKQSAGTLSASDIDMVNGWLSSVK